VQRVRSRSGREGERVADGSRRIRSARSPAGGPGALRAGLTRLWTRRRETRPLRASAEPIESLQRRLEESERWVPILDGQVRILDRERQKLSAIVGHTDAGFLVMDAALQVVGPTRRSRGTWKPAPTPEE